MKNRKMFCRKVLRFQCFKRICNFKFPNFYRIYRFLAAILTNFPMRYRKKYSCKKFLRFDALQESKVRNRQVDLANSYGEHMFVIKFKFSGSTLNCNLFFNELIKFRKQFRFLFLCPENCVFN